MLLAWSCDEKIEVRQIMLIQTRFTGPVNVVLFNFLTWQQLDECETLIQLTVLIMVIGLSGVQFSL